MIVHYKKGVQYQLNMGFTRDRYTASYNEPCHWVALEKENI